MKLQFVMYQWICLDELCIQKGSFFSNFGIIFRINYISLNNNNTRSSYASSLVQRGMYIVLLVAN